MTTDLLTSQPRTPLPGDHARSRAAHLDEVGALPAGIAAEPQAPGIRLHDVLGLVQQHAPSAAALVVRDGRLFVAYTQAPQDAERAAARAALADEAALAKLASRGVATATEARPDDLRAQLLDAALPDDAWLRAFRRHQVALLSAEPTGLPDDTRPNKPRRGKTE